MSAAVIGRVRAYGEVDLSWPEESRKNQPPLATELTEVAVATRTKT
jgi:hypothetical protein